MFGFGKKKGLAALGNEKLTERFNKLLRTINYVTMGGNSFGVDLRTLNQMRPDLVQQYQALKLEMGRRALAF